MRTSIVAGLALLVVACTGQQEPAPVRSVARPTPAPVPYREPVSPTPAPPHLSKPTMAPQPMPAGPVHWHSRIADAQAEARASGRLILVGSTKPGCTLCDKFAHETVPQCSGRLSSVAVCYMYDITRPEDGRVDRTLRSNLVGAAVMPLVGFLTADLQWVTGFSGPRSAGEFLGDIENARRIHPVAFAPAPDAGLPATPATAFAPANAPAATFVNEYGETEWSAPAGAWPAPEDAITGTPSIAAAPALAPAPAAVATAPVEPAPAPVATTPVEPAPVAFEPAPEPAPMPAPTAAWSAPVAALPAGVSVSAGPVRVPAEPPVAAAPMLPEVGAGGMTEDEARASLAKAFTLIRDGRYDEAKAHLRLVSRSLPHSPLAREADKGGVAVYNARRIADAEVERRPELAERARRDLGTTMWAPLF